MFFDGYKPYLINKNNVFSRNNVFVGDYPFPLGGFESLRLRL